MGSEDLRDLAGAYLEPRGSETEARNELKRAFSLRLRPWVISVSILVGIDLVLALTLLTTR